MRPLIPVVVVFVLMVSFAVLDKASLHWYVPEARATPTAQQTAEAVAREILGAWDRSVPQAERSKDNHGVLRESVMQPGPGSAVQLQRALVRTANAAALPLIGDSLVGVPEREALEALSQCVEFLLGLSGTTIACNLFPISP